jgi:hypothetical protein
MEVWQKMLLAERKKHNRNTEYLEKFIAGNPRFEGFPERHRELLKQQLGFMQEYRRILDIRISELPPEPEPAPVIEKPKPAAVIEKPKPAAVTEKPPPGVKQRPLFDRRAALMKSFMAAPPRLKKEQQ